MRLFYKLLCKTGWIMNFFHLYFFVYRLIQILWKSVFYYPSPFIPLGFLNIFREIKDSARKACIWDCSIQLNFVSEKFLPQKK